MRSHASVITLAGRTPGIRQDVNVTTGKVRTSAGHGSTTMTVIINLHNALE